MSQEEIVELKDGTKALVLCKGSCALTVRPLNWDKNKIERMGGENFAFVSIGWDWVKAAPNEQVTGYVSVGGMMNMVKVFTTNSDGKIEFYKDELEKVLNEVWQDGRNSVSSYWYSSPTAIPYYTDKAVEITSDSGK